MVIKKIVCELIGSLEKLKNWAEEDKKEESIYSETESEQHPPAKEEKKVFSLWDFIEFKKGTQSDHLTQAIGFDEWLSMDEIRYRINELMGVEYKNERSLYPYIKTLVDCGFLNVNNVGGRRRWKRNECLIEVVSEEEVEREVEKKKEKIRIIQ